MAAEDVTVKEIAAGLNRSDLTVRNHIQAIFKKVGVEFAGGFGRGAVGNKFSV